ncbi:MAG: 1-phosphofructokinase [Ruminococcus sp.]|nr:1-phosphofructokinase [Ruminococcus sp.]
MIYTVSFNPAWDYVMVVDDFTLGKTNRSSFESVMFGGKGINVSAVLKELDLTSTALGFIAGFTGDALEKEIQQKGIKTDFIKLSEGMTRINVKLKTGKETEINGRGPKIDEAAIKLLFEKLQALSSGDTLVLAGSIPAGMPDDIYENIMKDLMGKGITVVVDATKDLLLNVLKYKPFLIKPNVHELEDIFKVELKTDEEIIQKAKVLQDRGAENVLISMGGDGAILVDENASVHKIGVAEGKVINSVGAGDSMVAGFVAGYEKYHDYSEALKLGTAAGNATAFSEGLAKRDKIDAILKTLN